MESGIMMEFCGGLGNKMFQLAAGYAASKKYGCPLYVKKQLDKNHHQNIKKRIEKWQKRVADRILG
jgi:hypothetical protein